MLAVGLKQAREFSKNPILIAKCQNHEKHNLYYVEEGILPCRNCERTNPLELLSKKEIYALKRKYKVSSKLLKTIEECYSNSETEVNIENECKSLASKIFVESLETKILNRLKKQIRLENVDWLPHYDPETIKHFNQHTILNGPSGVGKSTLVTRIIEKSLPDATAWCFGPLISKDPAFKNLQKVMTKRKVKLVDSHKISTPIDIHEIAGSKVNVLVVDDPDSMGEELKHISDLCTKSLYMGRHIGVLCFTISHDAFTRRVKSIKASCNECSRCILFPQVARHVAVKFMKFRLNMSKAVIDRIFNFITTKDRWICIINHHPCCVLTNTGCLLL